MYQYLNDLLTSWIGRYIGQESVRLIVFAVSVLLLVIICVVLRYIVRVITVKVASRLTKRTKYEWDDILLRNKLFHRLSNIVVPFVISMFRASMLQSASVSYLAILEKAAGISGVIVCLLIVDSLLNAVDEIYRTKEVSKLRPIKGFLQVIKVAAVIVGGVVCVAVLAGESPLVLLGGIGAMTAVTSLIFKDAILGFVAGIQLTGNDMIRIGDWIEVPKCSANGTVVDLSMTTVKVENFDKTITAVPAYTLVSDAFINWRGMETSGGRRIKRAIYIDAQYVKLCDDEMIERFRGMALITSYIDGKLGEIQRHNDEKNIDMSVPVNGRRITNIGTFRAYIAEYLKSHPGIHKGMTLMVRQLTPDDRGLPLEVYAFANTVNWADYEGIQSDIFDHLYSVASEFGLKIYQKPSGSDVRNAGKIT